MSQVRCVHYLNVAPRMGAAAAAEPDFNDAIRALNFRKWQSLCTFHGISGNSQHHLQNSKGATSQCHRRKCP